MSSTAKVKIWDAIVGAVTWRDEEGMAYFEYDKSFEKNGWNLSPLMMPIGGPHKVYSFPSLRHREPDELNAFNGLPGVSSPPTPYRGS